MKQDDALTKTLFAHPYLKEVVTSHLDGNGQAGALTLQLTLSNEANTSSVRLRATNATNVQFSLAGGTHFPIVWLTVYDFKEEQWDSIRYEVVNSEQDILLRFHCSSLGLTHEKNSVRE